MAPSTQNLIHLLVFGALIATTTANRLSPNISTFISNGLLAAHQPHNVHVMAFRETTHPNEQSAIFGGGCIVTARHVVTAAHLIFGFGHYQVGYGSAQLMQLTVAHPATSQIYPGYVPATRQHDIAILTLRAGTTWTTPLTAHPIRWSGNTVDPIVGRVATVVGFGFTFPNEGFPSMQLRQAQLTVGAPAACRPGVSITGSHFCALPSAGRNVCAGDGGAGLFASDAFGPVLVSYILID